MKLQSSRRFGCSSAEHSQQSGTGRAGSLGLGWTLARGTRRLNYRFVFPRRERTTGRGQVESSRHPPTSWPVIIMMMIFIVLYSLCYIPGTWAASQQQLLVRYSWGAHYELWAHIIIGIFYLFPSWESVSSINKIPAQCDGVTGEQVPTVQESQDVMMETGRAESIN